MSLSEISIPEALISGIGIVIVLVSGWWLWLAASKRNATAKNAYFIFFCGPVLSSAIFLLCLFPGGRRLLHIVFLSGAIFLPASLYFLFIAARRESLFNAFTTNLSRLGLLRRWWTAGPSPTAVGNRKTSLILEGRTCYHSRIKSYFDRFGAIYGSVEKENFEEFLKVVELECGFKEMDAPGTPTSKTLAGGTFDFPPIIPVLGATCLLALGWICVLPPKYPPPEDFLQWFESTSVPTPNPVIYAFLGAYFFSLQMIIKRFVRHDLGANAYNAISLRIILAVVGVWVAIQIFAVGFGSDKFDENHPTVLVACFAIGAFPLVVWQLVTATLKKFPPFQAALPSLTASQPLDAIDGLSIWGQMRLEEEGIESVPNLATADLVDLMLNTKIPSHRLIDWVDQAILLIYLGAEKQEGEAGSSDSLRDRLKKYGIRTATALASVLKGSSTVGESAITLPLPNDDQIRLRSIVAAMHDCPNFLLVRNWRGIADYPEAGAPAASEAGEPSQYPKAA
jgi:hypothetical protein